jgi:DNA-binding response OmpR family regulator
MAQESERSPDSGPDIRIPVGDELLFRGENPQTDHAVDAAHWMNIYRELIAFQEGLLARNGHADNPASENAGAPVSLDAAGLKSQLEQYRRRLEFWYDRHWELRGLAIDGTSLVATHREHKAHLTRREFQLLSFFLAYPNQTFTASVLAQRAWSDSQLSNDQVRIYVARLRARLADLGLPCRLVSHPRRGYSFDCD